VFDELAEGGVDQAVFIAHADVRRQLEQVLEDGKSWGIAVSHAETPDAEGQRTVLRTIRDALCTDPVLVYPADCLLPGQVTALRDRFSKGDVDCVLLDVASGSSLPEPRTFATAVMLGPRTREVVDDAMSGGRDSRGLDDVLLARGYRVAMCEATKLALQRFDRASPGRQPHGSR
jgi:dTDP-glucose pyrophosphorylase